MGDHERADAQNVQVAAVYEEVGVTRYVDTLETSFTI